MEVNMWKSLLEDVGSHTSNRKLKPKNLLFLGDEGAGKNTVIQGLQGRKATDTKTLGTGMEYTFVDVRDKDEGDDVIERMGCYILNGTTDSAYLLQLVLSAEHIEDALIVIVADLARPWLIMDSLEKWSNEISTHLESLSGDDKMQRLREERIKTYQTFSEDAEKKEGEEQITLDLEEGVLDTNFGIPLIVVATKSDCLEQLSQDYDYHQEHLDYIQFHIRRFCLKHGASLVYLGKGGKNKDVLYRCILHAAYSMPLAHKANVAENDAVFVPSGWDNSVKINVLTESFQKIKGDDNYAEVIKSMQTESTGAVAKEVKAEDEQEFLKKQQPLLGSSASSTRTSARTVATAATTTSTTTTTTTAGDPTTTKGPGARDDKGLGSPARTSSRGATGRTAGDGGGERTSGTRTPLSRSSTMQKTQSRSPRRQRDANPAEGQDVLADFFNSLLQKREVDKKGDAKKGDGKK